MNILFDKKITFAYEEQREQGSKNDDSSILYRGLLMYADGERIFRGYEVHENDIIEKLSEMALAILRGEYEYKIWFSDDDEDMDLGFIKAGRVVQVGEGVLHHAAYYTYPEQLVTAIIELLKSRAEHGETSGRLIEIEKLIKDQREYIIDNDIPFSLELQYVDDYHYKADRLKIQWGDGYYYTDTVFTNVIEQLLYVAISLLKNENKYITIEIADYNDDVPLAREKREKYYRTFSLYIRQYQKNDKLLDVGILEDPWYEDGLIISVDEFISAVNDMIDGALKRYDVDKFNALHSNFHGKVSFPTERYEEFKRLMNAAGNLMYDRID